MKYLAAGIIFWCAAVFALFSVRPNAFLNRETIEKINIKDKIITAVTAVVVILLCVLPMGLSPIWNGEIPEHRNQYEVMAESLLDGRIDLDYGDMDPRLLSMDNPYNYKAREKENIDYHWDHAFYNGKYYMYYGIVPVFLTFLPYRAVTGAALTTYHATQIFTAFIIIGFFYLFYLIAKKYFGKMSLAVYLSLSAAVSAMSVWYFAAAPALYCTAISAGVCLMIWSLVFLVKAVYLPNGGEKKQNIYLLLGGVLGALTFGCRPTVALANLLLIPMIVHLIKERGFNLKVLKQLIILIVPYIAVGALLMYYNYIRFGSPFEFGQSYQLTVADQSGYGNFFENFNLIDVINGISENFFAYTPLKSKFPYISHQSVFFNFPVCVIGAFCLFQKDTLEDLKKEKLSGLIWGLILCPIIITIVQIAQAPVLIERYRSDFYWIIGILLFLIFGFFTETLGEKSRKAWNFIIPLLSFITIFGALMLWLVPADYNFTTMFPDYLKKIESIFRFGL